MSFTGIFWLGQNVNVCGDKAMVVNLTALLHPKIQKINAKTSLTETVDCTLNTALNGSFDTFDLNFFVFSCLLFSHG